MSRRRSNDWISASQVATHEYCTLSLHHSLVGTSRSRESIERLQQGTKQHHAHGTRFHRTVALARFVRVAAGIAFLAALGFALWSVLRG